MKGAETLAARLQENIAIHNKANNRPMSWG